VAYHIDVRKLFPPLAWKHRITRPSLRADLIAGFISAVVVVPQAIAFATLAGLPAEYGLYAAIVPAMVAALFGSSWHAVTGPTNAVSLFVFVTVSPLAIPGSPEYISLVLTLSFMAGLTMLAMGLLRMGRIVNFVSHTVVVGFTAGAGTLIIAAQLRNFFGVELPAGSSFITILSEFVQHASEAKPYVVLVGVATLAAAILSRLFVKKLPYMLTALVVGSVVGFFLNLWLGHESHPDLSPDTLKKLMGIAFGVTVLVLTEGISIARGIALKSGQRIDSNQEFVGQGLANMAASFFSGYPSAASFNRSGINYEAGARTPLAAASSAAFLILVMFVIAPLIAYLPIASMAAILFLVAWGLFDFDSMRIILRASRSEAAVLLFTYVSTLVMHLETAILVGVTLSLLIYLNRTSRPQMRTFVPDPRHEKRRMAPMAAELAECPQVKIMSVEGSIYFGAVDHVESHLDTLREVAPGQKHLLIIARNVNFVDVAGAEALVHEARKRRWDGGTLALQGLRQPVQSVLRNSGLLAEIGEDNIFRSKIEAIAALFSRLDRDVCSRCRSRIFQECASLPPPAEPPPRA